MKRSVSITATEDEKDFSITREVWMEWPGREPKPLMEILDETVGDVVKKLEELGHG
jgi:hypothetical protein